MITSKQRAYLRSLANNLDSLYQIGKDGVGENTLKQFDEALNANEMIKVTVLKTALLDPKAILGEICEKLKAEPVSSIGYKIVLYRESKNNKQIQLPR